MNERGSIFKAHNKVNRFNALYPWKMSTPGSMSFFSGIMITYNIYPSNKDEQ